MTINQSDCQIQSHDSGSHDSVIGNITLCLAMFDVSVFSWYAATHNCCQTWTHNAMITEHRWANPGHCQRSQTLLPCTAEFQIIKENTHDIDIIADKPKKMTPHGHIELLPAPRWHPSECLQTHLSVVPTPKWRAGTGSRRAPTHPGYLLAPCGTPSVTCALDPGT